MNAMNAVNAVAVSDDEMAQEFGYSLYLRKEAITQCNSINEARGWLEAQWQEGAAHADVWNVRHTQLHPRHLSDTDVAGIIAQAEDIAERADADNRRMGW